MLSHRNGVTNDEREGHEQTARGHERDHVADTGHHGLADAGTPPFGGVRCLTCVRLIAADALGVGIVRGGQCLVNHFAGLVDTTFDRGGDVRQPREPGALAHVHVGRENDGFRIADHGRVQPSGAPRTLGLDLQIHTHFVRGVLE